MSMTKVPTGGVQQSEVVPSQWATVKIYIWLGYVYIIYTGAKILYWIFLWKKLIKEVDVKTRLGSVEANEVDYSGKPTYLGRQYCWKSQSRLQIHSMCTATTPPVMDSWV